MSDKYEVVLEVTQTSLVRVIVENDNPSGGFTPENIGTIPLSVAGPGVAVFDDAFVAAHAVAPDGPQIDGGYLYHTNQPLDMFLRPALVVQASRLLPVDNAETVDFKTSQVV